MRGQILPFLEWGDGGVIELKTSVIRDPELFLLIDALDNGFQFLTFR